MDQYSRRVLAWTLTRRRTAAVTCGVLDARCAGARGARRDLPQRPRLGVHGRRRSARIVARLGFVQSASVRGPGDNAHMESFFHSLKAELTRGVVFTDGAAAPHARSSSTCATTTPRGCTRASPIARRLPSNSRRRKTISVYESGARSRAICGIARFARIYLTRLQLSLGVSPQHVSRDVELATVLWQICSHRRIRHCARRASCASAQGASVSAVIVSARHTLLGNPLTGGAFNSRSPRRDTPVIFRFEAARSYGHASRIGVLCVGFFQPPCSAEQLHDDARLTSASGGIELRVFHGQHALMALTTDRTLASLRADTRGLSAGQTLTAASVVWGGLIGAHAAWTPVARVPIALEIAAGVGRPHAGRAEQCRWVHAVPARLRRQTRAIRSRVEALTCWWLATAHAPLRLRANVR